ncbi:MAG: DUF349 domain-containing protein [Prevotellaceae bacterium]|jgi:hypothetical protein|nr:DUF349 domain-containing protein [Prevotellaceae bacterium]
MTSLEQDKDSVAVTTDETPVTAETATATENSIVEPETPEAEAPVAETQPEAQIEQPTEQPNWNNLTQAELVDKLREIIGKDDDVNRKAEVDLIKQLFYKKQKVEKETVSSENEDAAEAPQADGEDVYETELKALLNDYKEKRNKIIAENEAQKAKNLQIREAIIDKLKSFIDQPDSIHVHFSEVKQLQQEWRETGAVPADKAAALNKEYILCVENFYDLLKMNNELRDYDFKKNLEMKTAFCEAAEKLNDEENIVSAFHNLQQLHEKWQQTGPVAKELREQLWQRFKAASTNINKKYQAYFEELKQQEEANLQQKIQICEALENINLEALKTFKDWENATEEVIKLQKEWKTIGFATRKMNVKIYERYRTVCDKFFSAKSAFYKEIKDEFATNLEKKKALIAKAESLKDSTEWKEATQQFVELQKEWKSIGAVPRKLSDVVWKQFVSACDYFFEQKEKVFASQKSVEKVNLDKKLAIIEKIENFASQETGDAVALLKGLIAEFNGIGHVPFKEKDKVYKRFRAACDKQFDALNVEANNRRIDMFAENIENMASKDKHRLFREREKLLKQFERLKSEILTCENNIGFFSSKNSKKPNPMILEMQRNIEKLKTEKELMLKKIQLIETQLA